MSAVRARRAKAVESREEQFARTMLTWQFDRAREIVAADHNESGDGFGYAGAYGSLHGLLIGISESLRTLGI